MRRWGVVLALVAATCGRADTTVDPTNTYAYGANIGWLDARGNVSQGAVIGQAFCSGFIYGANVGWVHLGDGAPADGVAYDNTSASDFGVNHDGDGRLTGYAYGANIGWVTFEQVRGLPRVDLETGQLGGYAWGANIGWIDLSRVTTRHLDTGPDSDNDGIPDAWEYGHTNTLGVLSGGGSDSDGDGVPDSAEYSGDTDPFDADDYLRITDFTAVADTNSVTWTCVPTRQYTLLHANTLSNTVHWGAAGSSFVPPSGPHATQLVTGVSSNVLFYRVQVEPPLGPAPP